MLELARSVSAMSGYTVKDCQEVLRYVTPAVVKAVADGEEISICGCRFIKKVRSARDGRNPATGETIHIPETGYLYVKPSPTTKAIMKDEKSYEAFMPKSHINTDED